MIPRSLFVAAILIAGLASACSQAAPPPMNTPAQPTAAPATRTPGDSEPTPTPDIPAPAATDLPALLQAMQAEIARNYGLTEDQVVFVSSESVTWPDSCLGVEYPGMACMDVITPGSRIFFKTPHGRVEVHASENTSAYLIVPAKSGIEGQALVGPACPGPEKPGQVCADKPYQGSLWISSESGTLIAEVTGDIEGGFKVNLPPGSYLITQPAGQALPSLSSQSVIVKPNEFTQVQLILDSGIR